LVQQLRLGRRLCGTIFRRRSQIVLGGEESTSRVDLDGVTAMLRARVGLA
jgi:hypothetical protein